MDFFFDHLFPYLFPALIVLIGASLLFRMVKYGGLRGATFGARIDATLGEVDLPRSSLVSKKIRVHVLQHDTEQIGLEFVARSVASWQMMPFSLTRAEAHELIVLLQRATGG